MGAGQDEGLDILRTSQLALMADGWIGQDEIVAIRGAIEAAIRKLGPVREVVNKKGDDWVPGVVANPAGRTAKLRLAAA